MGNGYPPLAAYVNPSIEVNMFSLADIDKESTEGEGE